MPLSRHRTARNGLRPRQTGFGSPVKHWYTGTPMLHRLEVVADAATRVTRRFHQGGTMIGDAAARVADERHRVKFSLRGEVAFRDCCASGYVAHVVVRSICTTSTLPKASDRHDPRERTRPAQWRAVVPVLCRDPLPAGRSLQRAHDVRTVPPGERVGSLGGRIGSTRDGPVERNPKVAPPSLGKGGSLSFLCSRFAVPAYAR